jgi:hypothetical protein
VPRVVVDGKAARLKVLDRDHLATGLEIKPIMHFLSDDDKGEVDEDEGNDGSTNYYPRPPLAGVHVPVESCGGKGGHDR